MNQMRQRLLDMAADEQERRILETMMHYDNRGMTRDWFAVELRDGFDRLVSKGLIEIRPVGFVSPAGQTFVVNGQGRESEPK